MAGTMRGWAVAAGAVLLLGGCERTPTGAGEPGELSFSFSGDSTGSFLAAGGVTRSAPANGTYAVGALQMVPQGQSLRLVGQRTRDDTRVDVMLVAVQQPRTGTIDCGGASGACPFVLLFAPGAQAQGAEAEAFFLNAGGSVTITSIVGRRAAGTFRARLVELVDERAVPRTLEVSGSFDVPLLAEWAI